MINTEMAETSNIKLSLQVYILNHALKQQNENCDFSCITSTSKCRDEGTNEL